LLSHHIERKGKEREREKRKREREREKGFPIPAHPRNNSFKKKLLQKKSPLPIPLDKTPLCAKTPHL